MAYQTPWKDSRELIVTDSHFGNAKVDFDTTNRQIQKFFSDSTAALFVLPGFIAASASKLTTTLGRGGSDYTAAILAAALNAEMLEIWTDVSGIMTADPNLVSNAKIISADFLPGGHGTVAFWRQGDLPTDNSTSAEKEHTGKG